MRLPPATRLSFVQACNAMATLCALQRTSRDINPVPGVHDELPPPIP